MKRKRCFKCSKVRALSQFYKHPRMTDGHLGKCKDCTKTDVSANYRANKPAVQAYDRKRNKTPERKAQIYQAGLRTRARHPQRAKAWSMVSNAIRSGKLVRQKCEKCSLPGQAHHEDYSRPLDVRWLCFAHHRIEHGQSF